MTNCSASGKSISSISVNVWKEKKLSFQNGKKV